MKDENVTLHCSNPEISDRGLMEMKKEDTVGGIWFKRMEFNEGGYKAGHHHKHDHVHMVATGSVELFMKTDGDDVSLGVHKAGALVTVEKFKAHRVVALEDNTICYCIQYLGEKVNKRNAQAFIQTNGGL